MIPRCSLPCLGGAIGEGLVTSPLSCLTLAQSRLQKICLSVCNCRVSSALPKLSQAMSATILTHLHFTCTLKSQPCTGTTFGQGLYNVEQKALLAPEVTNQPSTYRIIESCGTWFVFHSPRLGEHCNQIPSPHGIKTQENTSLPHFHFPRRKIWVQKLGESFSML